MAAWGVAIAEETAVQVALRLEFKTVPAHCCPAFRLTPLLMAPGPTPTLAAV